MRFKVIFDTNSIRSAESVSDFLGGRQDLERFSKVSEIIIPDIVIEEIKSQKKRKLIEKRDSFLSNPFKKLLKIEDDLIEKFDIDSWISTLKDEEKIKYKTIDITKNKGAVLDKIKRMCLDNEPPIEVKSDKGFKDSYIYFSVIEYLDLHKDESIFVVTNDGLLKDALDKLSRVRVVKNYDEFEKYNTDYFKDDYFISRLNEELDISIKPNDIKNVWLNIDENWILQIDHDSNILYIEVDFLSREIISSTEGDFSEIINNLITSGCFASTHSYISQATEYMKYFSDNDILELIKAAGLNHQISGIADDPDVEVFFTTLYKAKSKIVPDESKLFFDHFFKTVDK